MRIDDALTPNIPGLAEKKAKLGKTTQQFEAFFLQTMLKSMRKTVPNSSSHSRETGVYTEMFDEVLAENMSKTGRFGFGDMLYRNLERALVAQETAREASKKDD
jgi:flagellar protein FlgJ